MIDRENMDLASQLEEMKREAEHEYEATMEKAKYNVKLKDAPIFIQIKEYFDDLVIEWKRQLEETNFADADGDAGTALYRVAMLQGHIQCASLLVGLPEVARRFLDIHNRLEAMESSNGRNE
jgi:hypothetical protein